MILLINRSCELFSKSLKVIGRGNSSISYCPRNTWDAKSVPWTDRRCILELYKNAFNDWAAFHDSLHNASRTKWSVELRAVVLKSQLFGEATDTCFELYSVVLREENWSS